MAHGRITEVIGTPRFCQLPAHVRPVLATYDALTSFGWADVCDDCMRRFGPDPLGALANILHHDDDAKLAAAKARHPSASRG